MLRQVVFGHDMDRSDVRMGEYSEEAVFEGAAGRRPLVKNGQDSAASGIKYAYFAQVHGPRGPPGGLEIQSCKGRFQGG